MTGLLTSSSKRISMWPLGQSSSPKVSIGRTRVIPGVSLETESQSLNCMCIWTPGCSCCVFAWCVKMGCSNPRSIQIKTSVSEANLEEGKVRVHKKCYQNNSYGALVMLWGRLGYRNVFSCGHQRGIKHLFSLTLQIHADVLTVTKCPLFELQVWEYESERSELYSREHTFHPEEPTIGTNICDWDR